MTQSRSEINEKDKWDVASFYPSWTEWEEELQKFDASAMESFKGHLGDGADNLKRALNISLSLERIIDRLVTYAHLRQDEDLTEDEPKGNYARSMALAHKVSADLAWFEPQLLALPDATLRGYLEAPELADYKIYLEKLVRKKPHTRTASEEQLIAMSGQALSTASRAFGMLENADFRFTPAVDKEGKEHELTMGSFQVLLRSQDRVLRKSAFENMHTQFEGYENTIAELLNGQVQTHIFGARSHNFETSVEAALFPHAIPVDVYKTLIRTVRNNLGPLHDYVKLRKEVLGVEQLHLYDMYVPIAAETEIKFGYDEAVDLVVESVAPLGADYQNQLKAGLGKDRWVDRYENRGKRSGAYSSGCYDSQPYILMNYHGVLREVLTLAHEAGHSMHSLLSHKNQPYQYSNYPIFVAEVASTFNEELLVRLLLEKAKSPEERLSIINQKVEDIRATLYRQTMFAEFELLVHEMAEEGIPLTPALMKEKYRQLNQDYFGDHVIIDDEIAIEWARIPHFYYNFYVYQYATGVSAALALCEKVLSGGDAERDAYLNFLKGGSSAYPIELLKGAGVDMTTAEPIESAIALFDTLCTKLKQELQ